MDLKESNKVFNEETGRHPWELARFNVILDLMKHLPDNTGSDHQRAILDVGCGDLYFLTNLSNEFPEAKLIGVDPALGSTELQKYREELIHKNISIHRDLQSVEIKGDFSFVLLLDVVEHIKDDVAFLSNLKNHPNISEKTFFIITVPAFQSLFCAHDTFLEHYRRYNNDGISAAVKASGLEIVSAGYFFFSLLLPRIITVVVEKLTRNNNSQQASSQITGWNGSKTATRIIKTLLLIDYRITKFFRTLGFNIVGLSNFVICKKPVS